MNRPRQEMTDRTRLGINDAQIHVLRAAPSAPRTPVLLLHGAMSSSAAFEEVISTLSEEHPVLAPDLRGMGGSSRVQALRPSTWVDDVQALLEHYDVGRVHLVGYSLGARVALKLAVVRPDLVASLCLDAPVTHEEPGATEYVERVFRDEIDPGFAAQLEAWNGSDWQDARDAYLDYRKSAPLQKYFDVRNQLSDLECPVAVCRGDQDDAVHPIAHAVAVHTSAPFRSRLWIRPDTNFSVARFATGEFISYYRRFLTAVG